MRSSRIAATQLQTPLSGIQPVYSVRQPDGPDASHQLAAATARHAEALSLHHMTIVTPDAAIAQYPAPVLW